jgi:ribosome-associated protein
MTSLLDLSEEFVYSTSRSSGPGGQNVNKVETKVELRFNIVNSNLLDAKQKERLLRFYKNKLIQEEWLCVSSQEKRTQQQNKINCKKKMIDLIIEGLKEEKERIPTKPTEESKIERIKDKKKDSELKKYRGNLKNKYEN